VKGYDKRESIAREVRSRAKTRDQVRSITQHKMMLSRQEERIRKGLEFEYSLGKIDINEKDLDKKIVYQLDKSITPTPLDNKKVEFEPIIPLGSKTQEEKTRSLDKD
jgi:hypothetical protein